jgi:type IV pilus assembly protein PilC
MSNYAYVAIDPKGGECRGIVEVADQGEALRRIKEMGLFPTKLLENAPARPRARPSAGRAGARSKALAKPIFAFGVRVKPRTLSVFTRQLATLVEAGMPLLRGLRTLREQEENPSLKRVLADLAAAIEDGSSLSEAVAQHPRVFNRLYLNMVKAGELGGALELTLRRLAEFLEKAQRIKGKIKAALFYPCAVLTVALGILILMMVYIVPRFKLVFEGLLNGASMPPFTVFVLRISETLQHHLLPSALVTGAAAVLMVLALRTVWGRWAFDGFKLSMPILGPVFRKAAISRFARTFGTLVGSGVPMLQALTIVKETAGNVVVARVIAAIHENVKQGDPVAPTMKASGVFPPMVAGMVDVGEQTGALPEMLMKIADNCDDDVDNATNAMTSLLEPIMIVILAVIVGSIVIAMFLPLVRFGTDFPGGPGADAKDL